LSGDYLFKEIPIGYMYADGSVDAKVRLPRIAKKNRKEYILAQKEEFSKTGRAQKYCYTLMKALAEYLTSLTRSS